MIIHVTREFGDQLWRVKATEDDGAAVVRNGHDVPFRPSFCAHGVVWDEVGRLVALANHHDPGARPVIVYRDDNNMAVRLAYSKSKKITIELPNRVTGWLDEDNLGNPLLRHVFRTSAYADRKHLTRRLVLGCVPGARAALDQLVTLVDGVRQARRTNPNDFEACQTAIERLGVAYRELRTPWCDTCKGEIIRQEHPARWAHVTEERPNGVPEGLDAAGHEVTVGEWNNA